ncbi:MAG: preprotein translocase subunit SecA [Deltaproteobacteria bacterium]|nr:MAG: preprotein translocase subunit SecA [Deltaproteobacteria bacterium]
MNLNFLCKSELEKKLASLLPSVVAINSLEKRMQSMHDTELKSRILTLKNIITSEYKKNLLIDQNILNDNLHEVFAIVREASKRALNLRHFDMQILGGIALHGGNIIEMGTGEGKTLTATLPAILNSLCGLGVHIITVNDYLASRDADWMGRLYSFLGLSVGVIASSSSDFHRKRAYLADITHGQNNEFGFDYLRDNMQLKLDQYVQRSHNFAIIDEVDSVLIDEARTPLIISGQKDESIDQYLKANKVVPKLLHNLDYIIDEQNKLISLTEHGIAHAEKLLKIQNLYIASNTSILHHLTQALRAHILFKRDIDYIVENNEVIIIDEHTGRLMPGRKWSDGLHQAIEAKENVKIQYENQTLASVTFQNYFKLYKTISGMTGTAKTESEEFLKIYNLDVLTIPTNAKRIRYDEFDKIFKTENEKIDAILHDILITHKNHQPILIGTTSVEKSELLSKKLKEKQIKHHVLNAKKHKEEAAIIAQAGRLNAVTIATNMAGRGTDIILGGDPEFLARCEVAKKMSLSNSQIAELAFLTGNPQNIIPNEENKEFQNKAISYYAQILPYFMNNFAEERQKVILTGGLRIIGTERHESRRIDNQLRGRAGRQGDPGSTRFYISLEDHLMRLFGSEKMIGTLESIGIKHGESIEHSLVNKSIESAQKKIENIHFNIRKDLTDYDNIINLQRKEIYDLRKEILSIKNPRELIYDILESFLIALLIKVQPKGSCLSSINISFLCNQIHKYTKDSLNIAEIPLDIDDALNFFYIKLVALYREKENEFQNPDMFQSIIRFMYLQFLDQLWKDHLQLIENLKEGIQFSGYVQKDPLQEYFQECDEAFRNTKFYLYTFILEFIFKVQVSDSNKNLRNNI